MEKKITPTHLAIAAVAIVAAVVALPMINSAYNTAYPPVGSAQRDMIDHCASKNELFNRWSKHDVDVCLAFERLR